MTAQVIWRRGWHRVLRWLLSVAVLGAFAMALFVYSGAYNVAATEQHTAPVYWFLKANMRQSVKRHSEGVVVPPLSGAELVQRGRGLFQAHCVRCHGAPGVAPDSFALGLTPAPANLAESGREWPAAELYWTIKHGFKMTGMPAWAFRLSEDELWSIVAYVKFMPFETPAQYGAAVREVKRLDAPESLNSSGEGDARRGATALQQYACVTCHEIPGATGATVPVGPPLTHMAKRGTIGGLLTNSLENMVRWLRAPQDVHPGSAMPNLGLSERDARDIAAYLQQVQ